MVDYDITRLFGNIHQTDSNVSLNALFLRQQEWSSEAFGTEAKTTGIMKHLRKETYEVEENPDDVEEYADLLILVIDACWRRGIGPGLLFEMAMHKMNKNAKREWPPLEEQSGDEPVEHIK